jgi:hypothetical protein
VHIQRQLGMSDEWCVSGSCPACDGMPCVVLQALRWRCFVPMCTSAAATVLTAIKRAPLTQGCTGCPYVWTFAVCLDHKHRACAHFLDNSQRKGATCRQGVIFRACT